MSIQHLHTRSFEAFVILCFESSFIASDQGPLSLIGLTRALILRKLIRNMCCIHSRTNRAIALRQLWAEPSNSKLQIYCIHVTYLKCSSLFSISVQTLLNIEMKTLCLSVKHHHSIKFSMWYVVKNSVDVFKPFCSNMLSKIINFYILHYSNFLICQWMLGPQHKHRHQT